MVCMMMRRLLRVSMARDSRILAMRNIVCHDGIQEMNG
jgi:hypothetical protein